MKGINLIRILFQSYDTFMNFFSNSFFDLRSKKIRTILRGHAHARIPSQKSCLEKRKKEKQLNQETVKARTVHNYFHLVPIGRYSFTPGVWKILWLSGERVRNPFPVY